MASSSAFHQGHEGEDGKLLDRRHDHHSPPHENHSPGAVGQQLSWPLSSDGPRPEVKYIVNDKVGIQFVLDQVKFRG